jgi:protein-S-isoprenylcysteine O-methyltransferase Ste14
MIRYATLEIQLCHLGRIARGSDGAARTAIFYVCDNPKEHPLVTGGLYHFVRHPIYQAHTRGHWHFSRVS